MSKLKQQFVSDLIADHGNSLERFLTRKLDNPSDAAEIAQEAYLRIYRLQQPEQLDNARAFLFQVASNLAVDHLRRRTLHYRFLKSEEGQAEEGSATDPNASGASPEKILAARERLALIYATIDELPLKCRQAFLMSRNSGLSYTEIAHELEVSVSSVEKYILQALKHCRAALARQDAAAEPKAGQRK